MGRKLLEIRAFNKGMAGNVDGTDPDEEVAALAMDVDPDAPPGVLRGLKGVSTELTHAGAATEFDRMGLLKKRSGENAIIGVEHATGNVAIIDDYDGTPAYSGLGSITVEQRTTISLINNQVYLGAGPSVSAPPKWIGEVGNNQFGVAPPSGYQMEDAEARPPLVEEFSSTSNIKPAGSMATSITVSGADPLSLPAEGYITIPFSFDGNEVVGQVYYGSRTATSFDGLVWPTNTANKVPDDYTIGSDADHDTVRYHEADNYVGYGGGVSPTNSDGFGFQIHDADNTSSEIWPAGQEYVIALSYIYDGYKESPLKVIRHGGYYAGGAVPDDEFDYISLKIGLRLQGDGGNGLPRRVTAVRAYIAPFSARALDGDTSAQLGSFRLANHVDIQEDSWTSQTTGYSKTFKRGSYSGDTYEDASGQPESLDKNVLHYGLSAQLNSELFIANVVNPSAPDEDWGNYVCKSLPLQFENFDWFNDYVVLPRPVTAIAAYAGRIYAFDEFTMYRINPQRMYIEDTYEGLGAMNGQCVQATEYGLFIASYNDVFLFDGQQISPISQPIVEIHAVDGYETWGYRRFIQEEIADQTPASVRLTFDSEIKSLVMYAKSATAQRMWIFRIDRQTWFVGNSEEYPAFCLSDRNSVLASGSGDKTIYELFRGTRQAWTWITKKLSMGRDSQDKKFREVTAHGASPTITYRIDSPSGAFGAISGLDSSSSTSKGKWLQVKLDGASGDELSALSILFRDKGGYPS